MGSRGGGTAPRARAHLVLPVVLLRVPQHPVAQPADVPEGGVPLVPELLQPQHRAIATVREGRLQQLEDLLAEGRRKAVTTWRLAAGAPSGTDVT